MVTVYARSPTNTAGLYPEQIAGLNRRYSSKGFDDRIRSIYDDFDPDRILVTSSFAATSAYFLHIISRIRPRQLITFIDTGFHFPETIGYKDYLIGLFGLNVVDLRAESDKHEHTEREQLYRSDPDRCCAINKIDPLETIKGDYDIWISSLMRWQTPHRATLDIFEERRGIIKFNPMLDVSEADRDAYIRDHDLPFHPLVAEGYHSIGCRHCTRAGEARSGRWFGKSKTECGLHL